MGTQKDCVSVLSGIATSFPPISSLFLSFSFIFPPTRRGINRIFTWFHELRTTMALDSSENSNWLFDYGLMEDITVPGGEFPEPTPGTGFSWPSQALKSSSSVRWVIYLRFFVLISCLVVEKTEGKGKYWILHMFRVVPAFRLWNLTSVTLKIRVGLVQWRFWFFLWSQIMKSKNISKYFISFSWISLQPNRNFLFSVEYSWGHLRRGIIRGSFLAIDFWVKMWFWVC